MYVSLSSVSGKFFEHLLNILEVINPIVASEKIVKQTSKKAKGHRL
jgi:hypothetical protein